MRGALPAKHSTAQSYDMKYYTDTRSIADPKNAVFIAIRTPLADGHQYIGEAYLKGVRRFIVSPDYEAPANMKASFQRVDDPLAFLQAEARRRLAVRNAGARAGNAIVIAGSEDKTLVKEMLYARLSPVHSTARSPRGWNSALGVPLGILNLSDYELFAQTLITETAIDAPGQGVALREILEDTHDIAVITPVTDEHDENFADHAAKIAEKIEIVRHCQTIVYADSDPELRIQLKALRESRPTLRLVPVAAGNGASVNGALTDAAIKCLAIEPTAAEPQFPVAIKREMIPGLRGNVLLRDYFAPDIPNLEYCLEYLVRHAGARRKVLFLGEPFIPLPQRPLETDNLIARMARRWKVEIVTDSGDLAKVSNAHILAYGLPTPRFDKVLAMQEAPSHDTELEVDLDAIVHNYRHFRSLMPAEAGIVAMVKANAYGLGAVEIGRTLQAAGAAALAVAVIEEGIALREAGITIPVIVLNPVTNRYPALLNHRLEPTVFSIGELRHLIAETGGDDLGEYRIHIKLDTGMHRVGFLDKDLPALAELLKSHPWLTVASVFSHLATVDCPDKNEYTQGQFDTFARMTARLKELLGYDFDRHILNSAGMMRFGKDLPYELGRLGIGLYGVSPLGDAPGESGLRPVATFRSRIISLKEWPAGTPIGYGGRGVTARRSVIATVPAGYADGINRHLGNGAGRFRVRGVACPTIGNICMDQCMIDVTDVPGASVGDEVEIFGADAPVESLASTLGTIPYEIFTSVGPRVRRIYTSR